MSTRNYANSIQSSAANYNTSSRYIYVNLPLPSDQLDPRKYARGLYRPLHQFISNQYVLIMFISRLIPGFHHRIRTSKYTIVTFVPKNLFEQFRRVANSYFLFLIILQAFEEFQVINAGVAAIPIIFIVAITALKDGIEDYRRWNADKIVNFRTVLTLNRKVWRNYNYSDKEQVSRLRRIISKIKK